MVVADTTAGRLSRIIAIDTKCPQKVTGGKATSYKSGRCQCCQLH